MLDLYNSMCHLNFDYEKFAQHANMAFGTEIKEVFAVETVDSSVISPDEARSNLKPFLHDHIKTRIDNIAIKFEEAVSSLSLVNPIQAFKLSGRTDFLSYADNVIKLMEEKEITADEEQLKKFALDTIFKQLRKSNEETCQFLKKNIRILAFQVSVICWLNTSRMLKRYGNASTEAWNQLDNYFKESASLVIKQALEHIDQSNNDR
ncbi:MAG: hypothetical protein JSR33_08590 [Proteobacteria bacterium]|nr:hypothetical protein [Pseudomonadota bacterium]